MRRFTILGFLLPLLVGCTDAFNAQPQTAARMDSQTLSVRRLAELMVLAQPLPLTDDVGEELARHWVEVSAFARSLADGDSLWDSSFVRKAMWLNLQQAAVARYRDTIAREALQVTPAMVDSAFRMGEDRIVAHVLKATAANASAEQRRAQRMAAEAILQRLQSGGTWEEANRLSDDSIARGANGNLGVLRRGVAVPRFENAAYALSPGTISPVVETQFGYHIIFRPALEDVRAQYTGFVRDAMRARFDSTYNVQLTRDLQIRATDKAPAAMKKIASAPFQAYPTDDALVTYSGGALTSARLAQYVRLLSPETQKEMTIGDAPDLSAFAVGVTLQEIIKHKADSAGLQVGDSAIASLMDSYHQDLQGLWTQLRLLPDSLRAPGASPNENAMRLVSAYFDAAVARQIPLTPIPPFLAAQLLEGVRWEINPRGIRASVQMAQRLSAASGDSLANE